MKNDMEETIAYIKNATNEQLSRSCDRWRDELIEYFASHGGHAGSSLGVIELLTTMLKEFDYTGDRFIFDVGHQVYLLKKFLLGDEGMKRIRKYGGTSGFMNKNENPLDRYISGHGGSGLSYGIGLHNAYRRESGHEILNVLCLIGDGSFSEGVVYESLNNLRDNDENSKLTIVLNDNGYAIEENVGRMSKILSNPEDAKGWFNSFGLSHIRCEDGHDIGMLLQGWREVKAVSGNCVYHVKTVKGYGLECALKDCRRFHYTEPFEKESGSTRKGRTNSIRYVDVNSKALVDLARRRDNFVVVNAAMRGGNGLDGFHESYPDRYMDVGMAEQCAVGFANGIAAAGKIPVITIHSAFLPRAYDQFIQDVCLQNIHAVLLVARSGFAGPDGPTHHGVFDSSYLRCVPGVTIFSPSSGKEYYTMIHRAVDELEGPIVILTPHATTTLSYERIAECAKGPTKCFEEIEKGSDILVMCTGPLLYDASTLVKRAVNSGVRCGLVHIKRIKPLDVYRLIEIMSRYDGVLIMEENAIMGGVGSEIATIAANDKLLPAVKVVGVPDRFVSHGDIENLRKESGMNSDELFEEIVRCGEKRGRGESVMYA